MNYRVVLFLSTVIAQAVSQNFRTLRLSKIGDMKYQCVASGCSPSTIIPGSYLRGCQMACLSHANCRTVTFDPSSNQCELFVDTPSQRGNMSAQAGVLTMIAIIDKPVSTGK